MAHCGSNAHALVVPPLWKCAPLICISPNEPPLGSLPLYDNGSPPLSACATAVAISRLTPVNPALAAYCLICAVDNTVMEISPTQVMLLSPEDDLLQQQ